MAFPTTAVLDDFNRADGIIGSNWITDGNTLNIASNVIVGTVAASGNGALWKNQCGPDCEIYATISNIGVANDTSALYLRYDSVTNNGYFLRWNNQSGAGNDTFRIRREDAGVATTLATYTQEAANGDSYGFSAVGNILTAYYKASGGSWVTLGTYDITSDATKYTGYGSLEVIINTNGGMTHSLDDVGGGTIGATNQVLPTSATTSATGDWAGNDWVRTAAIQSQGDGTADAAAITAATFDSGVNSYVLKASKYGFSIPDGYDIAGVIMRAEVWATASCKCDLAQLLDTSRVEGGTNMAPAAIITATTQTLSIGASDNLWGNALTSTWVKNDNFGVAIGLCALAANVDVFLDFVTLEIYYTASRPTTPLSPKYTFVEC